MKRTSLIAALLAGTTAFCGNFVQAQDRLLQKHHQRFKQRLNAPQGSSSIPTPTPGYESNSASGVPTQPEASSPYYAPESAAPLSPQTQPSVVSPSQPPAPIVSPEKPSQAASLRAHHLPFPHQI